MKNIFPCSLCRNGILGGALYLDDSAVTYKTQKLTVDKKYKNLILPLQEIKELSWKQILFPIATFHMADGETYTFIIFGKKRFLRSYQELSSRLC